MAIDFGKRFDDIVQAKQAELETQTAKELLQKVFQKGNLQLTELKNILISANKLGVLEGLKLSDVFAVGGEKKATTKGKRPNTVSSHPSWTDLETQSFLQNHNELPAPPEDRIG